MPRGYEEGPVAEAAQARLDALERGEAIGVQSRPTQRVAVYGSTEDEAESARRQGLTERALVTPCPYPERRWKERLI